MQVQGLHAVSPKDDCPHCTEEHILTLEAFAETHVNDPCQDCAHKGENWICLQCQTVRCSRYVQEHMVMHHVESDHPIIFSFADFSFWCYKCDSYIIHPLLNHNKFYHYQKFEEGLT